MQNDNDEEEDDVFEWEVRDESVPLMKHMIAGKLHLNSTSVGSCAGIVEHVGMFPIDTVKVSAD